MYEFISGKVVTLTAEHAVLEAGGIGYRIRVPTSTRFQLEGRSRALLYVAHRVINEQPQLFGFATAEERAVFERLCTISGIGPGTAILILSGLSLDEFREAVRSGQVRTLEKVKGVGRKTAQRLILELKEVLSDGGGVAAAPALSPLGDDAVSALVAIGYSPAHAEQAVQAALKELPEGGSLEDVVRAATRRARTTEA